MDISISDPEKVGEGMSAYIAYNVTTKTTNPSFKSPEITVRRRFSDFLGLHSRLSERYLEKGRIVPPAPEKSVVGMTKVKFSKSEDAGFIERRRAALERLESEWIRIKYGSSIAQLKLKRALTDVEMTLQKFSLWCVYMYVTSWFEL